MHALSSPSPRRGVDPHPVPQARVDAGRVLGLAGIAAYNWWVVVPFVPGLMPSANGFFSDLEATGGRDATWMQHADLVAGLLIVAAFLVLGSRDVPGGRREWVAMVT